MHLKNKLTAVLLIIAILSGSFQHVFIYAGFKLNQKFITDHLCENRDKPWLHCNGKCFFLKKIKAAQEKEKSEENQSQKNLTQETFCESSASIKFHTYLLQVVNTPYKAPAFNAPDKAIFQPPKIG